MADLCGKYQLASSEMFDEYMKALGVGIATRKMANLLTPVTEIKLDGEMFTITTSTTFRTTVITFKLGEEFDEHTADGRDCKSTITREGNKLIHVQKDTKENGIESTITREFTEDEMRMELTVLDVVCKRVYKKI